MDFFWPYQRLRSPLKMKWSHGQQLFSAAHRFIVSVIIALCIFSRTVLNGFLPKHRFYCKCKILALTFPRGHIDLFVCVCVCVDGDGIALGNKLFPALLSNQSKRRLGRVCNYLMAHLKQMPLCPILSL